MKFDSTKFPDCITHNLPNDALAVVDADNKIIAYSRVPSTNDWDWVRKDCRIGVDKADK